MLGVSHERKDGVDGLDAARHRLCADAPHDAALREVEGNDVRLEIRRDERQRHATARARRRGTRRPGRGHRDGRGCDEQLATVHVHSYGRLAPVGPRTYAAVSPVQSAWTSAPGGLVQ